MHSRRPARRRLVMAMGVALLLAACSLGDNTSGGNGEPSPPLPSPSRSATSSPHDGDGDAHDDAARRPNMLVITADDMRSDDLQWMPRTRRLLAGRGIDFRNSFSPNPLCCPARASFLTGRYSHNHRVLSHEAPYGFGAFDDSTTLATALQEVGYRTALVGKYLNGYGDQTTYGEHADSLHYVPPGWTQWWGSTEHRWTPEEQPGGGTYQYFNLTQNVNGDLLNSPGRYTTDVTAEQTRSLIRRFSNTPHNPWFLWWTPVAPHAGTPAEPDDPGTVRRADGFPVSWQTPARPEWVKHRFDDEITHGAGTPAEGSAESDLTDKPRYIRSYPGLTAQESSAVTTVTRQRAESLFVLDGQIATTLRELRRSASGGSTLVVFTSDNGYYLGEHLKRQGKINLHEPSVRVPLLLAGPGVPHGARYDPVTVEDLSTTLAAWAGVALPEADGRDLRSTIETGDTGWTIPVMLEGLMPEPEYARAHREVAVMRGLDTMGLRIGRWKFVRYSTGETEVYDLLDDPLELNSLSRSTARSMFARLERLWRRYANCAGAACRVPLPVSLRVGPELDRRITDAQEAARQAFFDY